MKLPSFSLNKKLASFFVTIFSILGYGVIVFAAQLPNGTLPPTGGYLAGSDSILDPGCAPQATDCVVSPYFITTSSANTWLGSGTGANGGSTDNTVFIGIGAGDNADNAAYSNFIGTDAGLNATNADHSNFFGQLAGCNATNADNANYFGYRAGCGATNANNANFFGNSSGEDAVNGANATYFGDHAVFQATDAAYANMIGALSGYQATGAYNSNFLGYRAGYSATNAHDSNFFGFQAGDGADDASYSMFSGNQAGFNAYGAEHSVMMGYQSGMNQDNVTDFLTEASALFPIGFGGRATFIGYESGFNAPGTVSSVFVGTQAGYEATHSMLSTFIGTQAGYQAVGTLGTVFLGFQAGSGASDLTGSVALGNNAAMNASGLGEKGSVFLGNNAGMNSISNGGAVILGNQAGYESSNVLDSVLLGGNTGEEISSVYGSLIAGAGAGAGASNINFSVLLGNGAGNNSSNINNAITIGYLAGEQENMNNTLATLTYTNLSGTFDPEEGISGNLSGTFSTIKTDDGISTIVLNDPLSVFAPGEIITGQDSGATAEVVTSTRGTSSILIGAQTKTNGYQNSIALGSEASNSANNQFMIGSSDFPIDEIRVVQTGGTQCIIDMSGLGCTSDERLKTNITDLPANILDLLSSVRTVKYNWKSQPEGTQMIGFLAQNLETNFPQAVATDKDGKKSVYYSQMIPVVVEAVKELNLKVSSMQNLLSGTDRTFVNQLVAWLGDHANGITRIFTDRLDTKQLCVEDVCVNRSQFLKMVQDAHAIDQGQLQSPEPITPVTTPDSVPTDTSTTNQSDQTDSNVAPEEVISETPAPVEEPVQETAPEPVTETPAQ